MKIADGIYLVGSGRAGCGISNMFDSHVYLVEDPGGHILIDAGVGLEQERILDNIRAHGLDPKDVRHLFLTHVHSDHAGGTKGLKDSLGCSVHIAKAEAELLRTGDFVGLGLDIAIRDGFYPGDYTFPPCEPDTELGGGETFTVGDWLIETIHTPGHSPGSMCYLVKRDGRTILFSGDVVVHGGKLMFLNCVGSVMADMRMSMPRLAGLGVEEFYPGHGCFVVGGGQDHIDIAIENLRHLGLPPNAL